MSTYIESGLGNIFVKLFLVFNSYLLACNKQIGDCSKHLLWNGIDLCCKIFCIDAAPVKSREVVYFLCITL